MRDLDLVCFTPKKDRPHPGVCQNRRGRTLSVASPGSRFEQRLGNRITGIAIPEPHGCRATAHPANEPEPCSSGGKSLPSPAGVPGNGRGQEALSHLNLLLCLFPAPSLGGIGYCAVGVAKVGIQVCAVDRLTDRALLTVPALAACIPTARLVGSSLPSRPGDLLALLYSRKQSWTGPDVRLCQVWRSP